MRFWKLAKTRLRDGGAGLGHATVSEKRREKQPSLNRCIPGRPGMCALCPDEVEVGSRLLGQRSRTLRCSSDEGGTESSGAL